MPTLISTLEELYAEQLRELYRAEERQVPVLEALAEAAREPRLASAFRHHLGQTREHAAGLEQLLEDLGASREGATCEAMDGLIRQAEKTIGEQGSTALRDVALVTAAQCLEHHEIACYGSVRTYATVLGDDAAAAVLQEILDQEMEADLALTQVAEDLNARAGSVRPAPMAL
jgi:ferritin-like metal-binding protein YciE